jgi:carboxypeptidase D
MLYIEQPVGTGYSHGTPNIADENDLAKQFVGFLQQFFKVFPELQGKKTYLTGESVRAWSFVFPSYEFGY